MSTEGHAASPAQLLKMSTCDGQQSTTMFVDLTHKALKAPQSWAENWSLNCNWLVSGDLLKNTSCNRGVSYITTHPTNMKTSFQPTSLTGWTRSCSGIFVLLSVSFWQLAARDITVLSFCSLTISEEHINQQSTQQHNAFPVVTSYSIKMCFTT